MFNFFKAALVSLITSVTAFLSAQQPVSPAPEPSPIIEIASSSPDVVDLIKTPDVTPRPSVKPTPTPIDIPTLIGELNKLKEDVLKATPEPTPIPEVQNFNAPVVVATATPAPTIQSVVMSGGGRVQNRGGSQIASLQMFLPADMDQVVLKSFTVTVSGLRAKDSVVFSGGLNPTSKLSVERQSNTTYHFSGSEINDGILLIKLDNIEGDQMPILVPQIDAVEVTDLNGNLIDITTHFPVVGNTANIAN